PRDRVEAEAHSGTCGVAANGSHAGSGDVIGLPSASALRMAVIGRQKLNAYFASQHAIAASGPAPFTSAKACAVSDISSPRATATARSAPSQMTAAEVSQNRAMLVCSSVRVALASDPISLISLKSLAYSSLVRLGPSPGRNCDPARRTQGCTCPHPGTSAARLAGGVGTQTPGLPAPGAV